MTTFNLNTANKETFNSSAGHEIKKYAKGDKYKDLLETIKRVAEENDFKMNVKIDQAVNGKRVINTKREFDAYVAKKYYDKYRNAESRGIHFDLSFTDIKKLLKETHCYFTGVEFVRETGHPLNITFERVDENEGYTKNNTKAVTHTANNWKSLVVDYGGSLGHNLPVDQIRMLLEKL